MEEIAQCERVNAETRAGAGQMRRKVAGTRKRFNVSLEGLSENYIDHLLVSASKSRWQNHARDQNSSCNHLVRDRNGARRSLESCIRCSVHTGFVRRRGIELQKTPEKQLDNISKLGKQCTVIVHVYFCIPIWHAEIYFVSLSLAQGSFGVRK